MSEWTTSESVPGIARPASGTREVVFTECGAFSDVMAKMRERGWIMLATVESGNSTAEYTLTSKIVRDGVEMTESDWRREFAIVAKELGLDSLVNRSIVFKSED